MQNRRHKTA